MIQTGQTILKTKKDLIKFVRTYFQADLFSKFVENPLIINSGKNIKEKIAVFPK